MGSVGIRRELVMWIKMIRQKSANRSCERGDDFVSENPIELNPSSIHIETNER
jgi:hypothetical protein